MLSAVAAIPVPLVAAPQWVSVGPAPIHGASGVNVNPPSQHASQDVGAVNALAVDPLNPEHVYAATVNGGIWETKDYNVAIPVWTTTTDHLPSLAISAIAISPVNDKVIYAGTGNYSSAGGGDVFGPGMGDNAAGIYKSTNGGATWTVLNPGGIFNGLRILRVVPTRLNGGQTVFAATTDTAVNDNGAIVGGGVYRSDDGGKTWTRLSGTANLPDVGVTDLVLNPANPNQIFAAIAGQAGGDEPANSPNAVPAGDSGIYRLDLSVPNASWQNITDTTTDTTIADTVAAAIRVELSISKAAGNPIWVTTITGVPDSYYSGVFRAPDAAQPVWAPIDPPDVLQSFEGASKGAMLADPSDPNLLYVAGDTVYYAIDPIDYPNYVARYDYGTNTWTNITPNSFTFAAVTQVARNNGVATLTSPDYAFAPYQVGQELVVAGLADSSFNGTFTITAVNGTTFSYTSAGPDVLPTLDSGTATLYFSPSLAAISQVERQDGVATLTEDQDFQSFVVGETVVVAGLSDTTFNGTFTITAVNGTTFSYDQSNLKDVNLKPDSGWATLVAFAPGTVEPIQTGVTSAPHSDTRSLQFGVDGQLLLADDGGVYECADPQSNGPAVKWSSINGSMADTEFYQVALDNQNNTNPADDLILGAAQDQGGSERMTNGTWVEHTGSDGVKVAADPNSQTLYFSEAGYWLNTLTGSSTTTASPPGQLTGTTNGAYVYLNPAASVPNGAVQPKSGFPFFAVFVLNQGDIDNGDPARILLAGKEQRLYLSNDEGNTYTSLGGLVDNDPRPMPNITGSVMAMAFGCDANPNAAYVCTGNGYVSVTQNINAPITAPNGGFTTHVLLPNGQVGEDVVIDPNNSMIAYVVTQSNVFMTTTGGAKWTSIKDNLGKLLKPFNPEPSLPASVTQYGASIALINTGTATKPNDYILVGEPGGVFIRPVNPPAFLGSNTWSAFGAGTTLPNTLFTSLVYDSKSDVLLAGTLGRGAWLLKNVRAAINNSRFNFPFLTGTLGNGRIPVLPAVSGLGAVPVTVNSTSQQVLGVTADQTTVNGVGSHDQSSIVGGVGLPGVVNGVELNQGNPSHDRASADALLFDSVADHLLFAHNGLGNLLTVG